VAFDLATRDHPSPGNTYAIGDRLAALVSSNNPTTNVEL
jgi:3-isopropylmalate dehydrogenase